MKTVYSALFLATFLSVVSPDTTFALGSVEMTAPTAVNETYSFDAELQVARSLQLSAGGGGFSDRSYTLGFSSGLSGDPENRLLSSADGSTIPYRVVDSAISGNDLKDLDDQPAQEELLTGIIPAQGSVTETFAVLVPATGLPAAGVYSDTVNITAYDSRDREAASTTLDIHVDVPTIINLSLVPPGAAFDAGANTYSLDFGLLEPGDTRQVDLAVRSNIGYRAEFSSIHNGNLSHTNPAVQSRVPYIFRFEGNQVDLSSAGADAPGNSAPTGQAGRRHPIDVEIGETSSAAAGVHEDTVQITVIAQ